ncbi:MAG: hypothetical protein AB7C95_00815 [Synergistaceae bacterium]
MYRSKEATFIHDGALTPFGQRYSFSAVTFDGNKTEIQQGSRLRLVIDGPEEGPQVWSLYLIPRFSVNEPADGFLYAVERHMPSSAGVEEFVFKALKKHYRNPIVGELS